MESNKPIMSFVYSLGNARTWIKNDIEHYLKLKKQRETASFLGSSELFGKKGIFFNKD